MKKLLVPIIFAALAAVAAHGASVRTVVPVRLGETTITVNVYENPGAAITFFAPHHNEQTGLGLAREFVAARGGRLVEIVSLDDRGRPSRYLRFTVAGKQYSVDPNRIFTENGRTCAVAPDARPAVAAFAGELMKLIFADGLKSLRPSERFLVAVHNNSDVALRAGDAQSDLTAVSFIRQQSTETLSHGAYEAQADGVFLSNAEADEDNFIFVSTPLQLGYFADKGFNVVVQKPQPKLVTSNCSIDDGSMSIYTGQNGLPYICLEADAATGAVRQRQMLEAVYGLL